MPNEDNKILKYDHGKKLLKDPFMIYAGLERFLEKMHSCQNNPNKFYTQKKIKHTPSGYSLLIAHLTKQKKNLIVTKAKTVWEGFART